MFLLLNQFEVFEKKVEKDTLKEKKEKVEKVLEKENYFGIELEKSKENEKGEIFFKYSLGGITFENLFSVNQEYFKDNKGKITNFDEMFGIKYKGNGPLNLEALLNISQKKSREETKKENYYNLQKINENLNDFIGKINLNYGKIFIGLNVDNPFVLDVTRNKSIEEVKDTSYQNDVKIINDYKIITNTEVVTNTEILNKLYFFGVGFEKDFKIKKTQNLLEFNLANIIPETRNNLKQIINNNTKINGYVFVETPAGIDTILIDEEENYSNEFNQKEKGLTYNILPILNLESKNDLYFIKMVLKKLITMENKFEEDFYGSLSTSLAINKFYPHFSFNYDNKKINLETKLYVFKEKNKDRNREKIEKIIRENKNIRYREIYLPKEYIERNLEDLEFKENKNYNFLVGGGIWKDNKKIKGYGEIGYGKIPFAIKISIGNKSGLIFSYKNFDLALKYLYHTKNKEEKIDVILQYGF